MIISCGLDGVGAAFLFVPLFYYLGVPLAEATLTALLLNVVSLLFATINYWRGRLINWRVGLPVLVMAVILSPVGARLTASVDKKLLLGMFAAFLVFAGFMMLLYKAKKREQPLSRPVEIGAGAGVGSVAGFLGGCWAWAAETLSCQCSIGWDWMRKSPLGPRR